MYTTKERVHYNITRQKTCKALSITENQYNWLRRKGNELRKIHEDNCNGVYDKEANILNDGISAEAMYGIDCSNIEGRIWAYLKEIGKFYIYYQTDPRGALLYIDTKEIPDNNYTQAYCIY